MIRTVSLVVVTAAATVALPVGALLTWSEFTPDVVNHPSRTADARLAQLRADAILAQAPTYLGQAATVTSLPCRDTPDGPRPPMVVAEFPASRPGGSSEAITALAKSADWQEDQAHPAAAAVRLRKPFGPWESSAFVTVTPAGAVTIELDASDDDSCP